MLIGSYGTLRVEGEALVGKREEKDAPRAKNPVDVAQRAQGILRVLEHVVRDHEILARVAYAFKGLDPGDDPDGEQGPGEFGIPRGENLGGPGVHVGDAGVLRPVGGADLQPIAMKKDMD